MNYIYDIVNHPKREIIEHRIEIIKFFDEFGSKAAKRAFGKGKSTIFLWKQKLKETGKLSSLAPKDKTPHCFRQKETSSQVIAFVRQYRIKHPGVGKETIKPPLDAYCKAFRIKTASESTIGRIITNLKEKNLIPKQYSNITINGKTGRLRVKKQKKKYQKLRRNGYVPDNPGDLVQIDTIELFIDGLKRYVVTAYDLVTCFAFAYCYHSAASSNAKDFLKKLRHIAPFQIRRIQTDNGSEFEKHFREYVREEEIIHFHNYPCHPQSNACVENFNGVIQRQFINWNGHLLINPEEFNKELMEYLIWYNTEKQHKRLGKVPPLKYYLDNFIKLPQKSNMLWTLAVC